MVTSEISPIGVVGGMGPYAGIDLIRKILDQTNATSDQDHLPLLLLSVPSSIPDRTDFLLGKSAVNPALAISQAISSLRQQGASIIGIPCNTAHAEPIYDEVIKRLPEKTKLVNMVEETTKYIRSQFPRASKIGILSTTGTRLSNVYPHELAKHGLLGIQVSEEIQERFIQPAIYCETYGIKAHPSSITIRAKESLMQGVVYLADHNVDAIILGCTEIPLALTEAELAGIPLVDTSRVLARALIFESSPRRLRY